MELKFQCDVVTPWGLFIAGIAETLRMKMLEVSRIGIELVPGEFSTSIAVAEGTADVGITTPPVCAGMAFRGVGPFEKKADNLRAIGSFPHDDRMMWAVPADSKIRSIEDMPKDPLRIVLPGHNYPVRFAVEKILELYGIPLDYLEKCGWRIVEDGRCLTIPQNVIEGRADALVHEARKTPAWRQLTNTRQMRFLPIRSDVLNKMQKEYGFRSSKLTTGMLRGVEEDVPCIDFSEWLMFVREDMPFDLAYTLTSIFVENRKELFEFFFRDLTTEQSDLVFPIDPRQVWKNVGEIPLHEASEKYYTEHGYMP